MPKKCKANNCNNNVWGGGYCFYHQVMRYDFKGHSKLKNKSRKPLQSKNKPHNRSKKRSKQEEKYSSMRREFIEYKKKIGEYRCVFCGERFDQELDIHHLEGRDNDKLLSCNNWELAHRKCHGQYHSSSVKNIEWFEGYLERIKNRHPSLYRKELLKLNKIK